jgi:hypothetical protein
MDPRFRVTAFSQRLVMPASGRYVDLTADDGFDAVLVGLLIKIDCAKHVAMICYG